MLLSPRGELYAKKLPELVRESVGVRYAPSWLRSISCNVKLSHLPVGNMKNVASWNQC